MTHDDKRHGTTTLFAALNLLTGTVIGQNTARHRHQEFLHFLNQIERDVPADKAIHVILDNDCTHKHVNVRAWACPPPPLDLPLHPEIKLLAERRRGLLRQTHPPTTEAWRLPITRRPENRNRPFHRTAQRRRSQTIHMARQPR